MTNIPAETKTQIAQDGVKFAQYTDTWRELNRDIVGLANKAIGNNISDNEPYTFRINFQNGRIVGPTFNPRLSVEMLNSRSETAEFATGPDSNVKYYEIKILQVDGYTPITNGDSWVARVKLVNDNVVEAYVNNDFDEEDRNLIKTVLLRGFNSPGRI